MAAHEATLLAAVTAVHSAVVPAATICLAGDGGTLAATSVAAMAALVDAWRHHDGAALLTTWPEHRRCVDPQSVEPE